MVTIQKFLEVLTVDYEEIMKCYEGETDIHASTSFEFGLMNDLYYQLFHSYPEVD